jgi:hypothetical protein
MTALIAIATLLLSVPVPPLTQYKAQEKSDIAQRDKTEEPQSGVARKSDYCKPHSTSKHENNTNQNNGLGLLNTVVASVGAVFSIGTLVLVWRQITVMRSSERAQIDLDFDVSTYTYNVLLSNYGKTIAVLTSYTFIHASFPLVATNVEPENALTWKEETWPMHAVLQSNVLQKRWYLHDFRQTLGLEVATRTDRQIIATGAVEYLDIFGKKHRTEVVYQYTISPPNIKPLWEHGEYT